MIGETIEEAVGHKRTLGTESLHTHFEGGDTPNRSRRWLPLLLLGALIGATGGCHNLRNQLKALTGADSTAGAATSGTAAKPSGGGHSVMPRAYGSRGAVPILDQTFHLRPDPAERAAGPGPRVPHFDWSGHDARLGGGLSDSPRHQRGD
jgi:hypothetical protein